jgi:hypothetical protein
MKIPSLRDYELGKTIPGGEALSMLMRAGISPAWLLTGEGEMLLEKMKYETGHVPKRSHP